MRWRRWQIPPGHPARRLGIGAACAALTAGYAGVVAGQATVSGDAVQWQTITLDFGQPGVFSELGGTTNPFLDYRLQVTFTNGSDSYSVPGYYAGNTDAATGNWRVHFTPDQPGTWTYTADFRTGTDAAVLLDHELPGAAGVTATGFHGAAGAFAVADRDPDAPGFLSQGRLEYVGSHYLKFRDGGYWIKSGSDSPENLLGYAGFDNTFSANDRGPDYGDAYPTATRYLHRYPEHVQDWNPGDPTWTTDNPAGADPGALDGKGLIGTMNYLANRGVNSVFFLPNNIGGDGQDTSPYADPLLDLAGGSANNNLRFDNSKLAQWEVAFDHAQRQGLHLHVVLNEAEAANVNELDDGTLGVERKLFYREMVARFGHHNALQWNLSEEYNNFPGSAGEISPDRVKEFAAYLSDIDPYDHPMTVHNGNFSDFPNGTAFPEQHTTVSPIGQRNEWEPFFGEVDFDLTSYQFKVERDLGAEVEYLRQRSADTGRPLVVMVDEPESIDAVPLGPAEHANKHADAVRREMTYDIYFSGGGVEWYVRDQDQSLEDHRPYRQVYRETRIAREFMEHYLPFWEMDPDDTLVRGADAEYGGAEVFAKRGAVYAIYLPEGSNDDNLLSPDGSPELDLRDAAGLSFSLRWFNPQSGGFEGDVVSFTGGDWVALGATPSGFGNHRDWVALVTAITVIPEPAAGVGAAVLAGISGRRRARA